MHGGNSAWLCVIIDVYKAKLNVAGPVHKPFSHINTRDFQEKAQTIWSKLFPQLLFTHAHHRRKLSGDALEIQALYSMQEAALGAEIRLLK